MIFSTLNPEGSQPVAGGGARAGEDSESDTTGHDHPPFVHPAGMAGSVSVVVQSNAIDHRAEWRGGIDDRAGIWTDVVGGVPSLQDGRRPADRYPVVSPTLAVLA